MKHFNRTSKEIISTTLCILLVLIASPAGAALSYWDPEGRTGVDTPYTTGSLAGTWESTLWARNGAGASGRPADQGTNAPVAWTEGDAAVFAVGAGATNSGTAASTTAFTVTMNGNHTVAGFFDGPLNPDSCIVTISGTGVITLAAGQDAFDVANSSDSSVGQVIVNNVLAGAGQITAEGNGQIFLNGTNTFTGGITLGYSGATFTGIVNFNNPASFGTGSIVVSNVAASTAALVVEGATAITITNAVSVITSNNPSLNIVGNVAGVTFSGPWNLNSRTLTIGSGVAGNLVTISGVVSGTGGLTKFNPANLSLSGANTYSGKTTIQAGILSVTSYNSVAGGSPNSSLGHPTTVANGTIALGSSTSTATNRYTGAGETTDRVIDLSGTTGTVAIENNGTGALIFTNDFTATGSGAKTLVLRGTNTVGGTVGGRIVDSGGGATSVTKADSGTWTLGGTNAFNGNISLNAGRLNLANPSALGGGTFVIGGNGSFDNLTGSDLAVANGITCSGGSPTYVGTANNMTINGAALITGANRTITVTAKTLTLGSSLGDSGQGRSLTKGGAGTLKLQGGSTYTGNTTISSGGGILMIAGTGQMGGGAYGGTIANSATFNYASSSSQTLSGVISGSGTLIQSGSATLTLTATNTYSGATTISNGTLALTGGGSLANGSSVTIASGATFDVSGRTSTTYTLGTSATLNASGLGITPGVDAATIVGASGGIVSLGSRPVSLTFTPTGFNGDSTHPSLYVSQGTLSLNGNSFTVNNASGTALDAGTYLLIEQASGSVTASGVFPATVTGSGVVAGKSGYISITGGNVNLIVAPTVSFSGLTPSQSIASGTTSITLAGTVSGAGPIYPGMGETVSAIINGNSQSTTINDPTGDFSFSYNPSTIPASGTPYVITYFYPGNGTSTSAAINTSTTLTVSNPLSSTNVILSISNNANSTFTLNFLGTPQASYYVQSTADLAPPSSWTTLLGSTNTAAGNGLWSFVVSNPAPAYYRSVAINPAP